MTGTDVDVETQAQQVAARGREALVQRMRTAYSDAAAAHADLISLDGERIEAMVQAATDRADGLQWRRALAAVAADELGLSPTAALSHPAVVRAQSLVGAPSYEQSLAEMIARPVPLPTPADEDGSAAAAAVPEPEPPEPVPTPAVTAGDAPVQADAEPPDELETVEADDVVLELLPEPDPIEYETEAYDVEAGFAAEPAPPPAPTKPFAASAAAEPAGVREEGDEYAPETAEHTAVSAVAEADTDADGATSEPAAEEDAEDTQIVIPAIHLGGVANLPTKREGLSVRLSADGLDIM
ncbi:MAG: hypothetical protein ACRDLT_02720, partial [Solirubrobacteraceae bacterium]